MYDDVTTRLIRSSPLLEGLDREALPDLFSQAFAEIGAARIRLRESRQNLPAELLDLIATMRRIAYANEALVAILPKRPDRSAAAFVAATAHQLAANADRQLRGIVAPTQLSEGSVSSDIAAMLLFMVAEATADAAEMAKAIYIETENTIERALTTALRDFCSGQLFAITSSTISLPESVAAENSARTANAALYRLILEGLHALARKLLDSAPDLDPEPITLFERARSLSVGTPSSGDEGMSGVVSAFPGPHHLASLLISVSRDISDRAITHIDPPFGVARDVWVDSMRRFAKTKPFLWRNHRKAIETGYLTPGVSAVVSFPTGAGKSTLANLKINATLLAGKKVIFLAPTNALVDQTSDSLRRLFPRASVQRERADDFRLLSSEDELPEILVMTPEACLFRLSIDPTIFNDVGLFVFDECHLLHPAGLENDRRAVDSMLCILNFAYVSPQSDFLLLSAMMKNADALAEWLGELTDRRCLSLDFPWKPTRQLRGSVIYKQTCISNLERTLRTGKNNSNTKNPTTQLKRQLTAKPHALFSLKQTWATRNTEDYTLVSLSDKAVKLGANQHWKLTPNAIKVTACITAEAIKSGVKTLAFFQSIKNARSAAREISEALGVTNIPLNKDEKGWFETAIFELGSADYLYLTVQGDCVMDGASVHHGLLLPEERRLCESLYRREDGLKALTATSTLAQGMNLPCELVIIGEDSRFVQEKDQREVLTAQELLNAAGRAGRAGARAAGIVLVVPGRVVGVDFEEATIGEHWGTLKEIFGQSDQCLEIDDPLTAVLDRIHHDVQATGEIERYAVARLAVGGIGSTPQERLSNGIAATFGAYKARQQGDTAWLEERRVSAAEYLRSQSDETEEELIEGQIAASLGLSLELVRRLSSALVESQPDAAANVLEWQQWLFRWLIDNPDLLEKAFRRQNLIRLFGRSYKTCETDQARAELVLPILKEMTWLWMKGKPLSELEAATGTEEGKLKTCDKARRFVVSIVPDLAYLFGLPALLHERAQATSDELVAMSHAKAQLGRCARMGLDSYEKAALHQVLPPQLSRRRIHTRYAQIIPHSHRSPEGETWDQVVERIQRALDGELLSP